ncbi:MFS general substrate transporter [Stemphylium lycopersici]|uniref:MFS general substrate transporter n=1 Tax=Stemphylium lycopersici TaxID=183478 RepID=A0A364NB45_STELY|nr:MFS general substrate transporter [Stemphylium lycopersici]
MTKNIQTATISLLADMATNSRWAKMREHKDERKVDLSCAPIDHTQFVRVYPRPQPRYARFPAGMSMFREEIDAEMTVPPQCQSTGERMSMGSNGKMTHRNQEPVAPRLASPVELDDIPSEPLQTESALLETPKASTSRCEATTTLECCASPNTSRARSYARPPASSVVKEPRHPLPVWYRATRGDSELIWISKIC